MLPSLASVKWDWVQVPNVRYAWISALDEQMVSSERDLNAQATVMREITELIQIPDGIKATVIFSHHCHATGDDVKISVCSGILTHGSCTNHPETLQSLYHKEAGNFVKAFRRLHQHDTHKIDDLDQRLGRILSVIAAECFQAPCIDERSRRSLLYKEVSYSTSEILKKVINSEDWKVDDPRPE